MCSAVRMYFYRNFGIKVSRQKYWKVADFCVPRYVADFSFLCGLYFCIFAHYCDTMNEKT
jgi:hypothetical protein